MESVFFLQDNPPAKNFVTHMGSQRKAASQLMPYLGLTAQQNL